MPGELDIAARSVARGWVSQQQLDACLTERRGLLQDGFEVSLRELLLARGLLDDPSWESLARELQDPRATRPDPAEEETSPRPAEAGEAAGRLRETATEGGPPRPQPAPGATGSDLAEELTAEPPGLAETSAERSGDVRAPDPNLPYDVLGGYRLISEIGRGAMGVVYAAIQERLGRRVALKILPETQALRGVARERFVREAKATAALTHPGIVPIYDIGESRGVHFFAMELLTGRSLKRLLEDEGRVAPAEVARIGQEAAEALHYAHEHGVVHRDVKPDNIVLREDGAVVLTDFGLARHRQDQTLTRAGLVVGTPLYMAPEQARADGKPVDGRADLYGLGVTLYELLAGRVPFEDATDTGALLEMVAHHQPPRLLTLCPDVPSPLAAIIEVAIEKELAHRYPDGRAMAEDLGRYRAGEPILARPPTRLKRAWRSLRRRSRQLVLSLALGCVVASLGLALHTLRARWQADAFVLDSIRLSRSGQRAAAEARLAEALELWPGLAAAHFRRGELAAAQSELGAARRAFDAALACDPELVEALLARGMLSRREGRAEEALADLVRARELAAGTDPRPALQAGLVLAELDRGRQARDWLREGLEGVRRARAPRDADYVEAVTALGLLELEAGRVDAALPELEEAVRLAPDAVPAHVALARALQRQGDRDAAIEAVSAAIRRDPQHLGARTLRGRIQRSLGRSLEAFADLSLAAKSADARIQRGLVRFESLDLLPDLVEPAGFFDYEGVAEDLGSAVEDESVAVEQRALARVALAWLPLLAERPRRSPALRQLDLAVKLLPRAPLTRLARAFLLVDWERFDEAEADLEAALTLEGGGYAARVGLARVAEARGQVDRARQLLDEAVELAPARASAYGYRYRLRLRLGDPAAEEDRARALARQPGVPETLELAPERDLLDLAEHASAAGFAEFARAVTQPDFRGRQLARAQAWLRRAVALDPWSLAASARHASVLYLLAQALDAERAYARARVVDPLLVEAEMMRGVVERDLLPEQDGLRRSERTFRAALEEAGPRPALQGGLRFELARTLVRGAHLSEALELVEEAAEFTPRRYCVASLRAWLLRRLDRGGAREAAMQAGILFHEGEHDGIRGALYTFAGQRLRRLDLHDLAEHYATRAIEADPQNAEAWRLRSRVRSKGTAEQLLPAFVDAFVAAELQPRYTHRFLEIEGRLSRFRPVLHQLRDRVDEVLAAGPELPAATFARGYFDFYAGEYAAAEAWFTEALELSRGRSYFSLTFRAAARLRLDELAAAREDLDRAEALFPEGPITGFWRACLQVREGDAEAAIASLEEQARRGYLFVHHLRETPELAPLMEEPRIRRLLREGER